MVGRPVNNRAKRRIEGGPGLPIFERIAPSLPFADLVDAIEAATRPGEAVLDLNGRGGWVARAAIVGQRRAVDVESLALTRLLAEVVVRPPDMRHVDAAVQAIATRPLRDSTVKDTLDTLFASRCPTCGLEIVLDALVWDTGPGRGGAGRRGEPGGATGKPRAVRREFGCGACVRRSGEPELRHDTPAPQDLELAAFDDLPAEVRAELRGRFPVPDAGCTLPDQLLDLHTPRQLLGLQAILAAIESDTRAAPVTAALRLAFLLAVESASRLNAARGRPVAVRIAGGEHRAVLPVSWRERNPWPAFLDGLAVVREFVARLEAQDKRSVAARVAGDLMDVQEGVANVVLVETSPAALRRIGLDGERIAHSRRRRSSPATGWPRLITPPPGRWAPPRLRVCRPSRCLPRRAWGATAGPTNWLSELPGRWPSPRRCCPRPAGRSSCWTSPSHGIWWRRRWAARPLAGGWSRRACIAARATARPWPHSRHRLPEGLPIRCRPSMRRPPRTPRAGASSRHRRSRLRVRFASRPRLRPWQTPPWSC
jgi:hypothetical protein